VSQSSLAELYIRHPVCAKICLFEIQNRKFSAEGHSQWEGGKLFPHPGFLQVRENWKKSANLSDQGKVREKYFVGKVRKKVR